MLITGHDETTATQDKLIQTFQLDRYAPSVRS